MYFSIRILHYLFSGIATILSYGSTYAKQLGYSKITVGYMMMCLFILSMLVKPAVGAVVDKFPVKKYIFLIFIFLTGISAFFLMFVPRLSLKTLAELDCSSTSAIIKIYSHENKKLSRCDKIRLMGENGERLVNCKVFY